MNTVHENMPSDDQNLREIFGKYTVLLVGLNLPLVCEVINLFVLKICRMNKDNYGKSTQWINPLKYSLSIYPRSDPPTESPSIKIPKKKPDSSKMKTENNGMRQKMRRELKLFSFGFGSLFFFLGFCFCLSLPNDCDVFVWHGLMITY